MRLKRELNKIISGFAVGALVIIGLTVWGELLRVHKQEVQAQGHTMAFHLSRACAVALASPNAEQELEYLLSSSQSAQEGQEHHVVSAIVFDLEGEVLAQVGATSREQSVSEGTFLARVLALGAGEKEEVVYQEGEVEDRYSNKGEEIFEFGASIRDHRGKARGVLILSLLRRPIAFGTVRTVVSLVLVAAVLVGGLWFTFYKLLNSRFLNPILQLSQGIERVRAGDLAAKVEIVRQDEIGTLVHSFNDLIGILVERDSLQARLLEANRLAEAHAKLHEAHRQLKQAQEQLILNEKHASLGRLVHALNHELNNPLSAAQNMIPPLLAAIENLRQEFLQSANPPAPPVEEGEPGSRAPSPAPEQSEGAQAEATSSEKADTAEQAAQLSEDLEDVESAVEVIRRSVARAINIVHDLGAFSRLGTADLQEVLLQEVIEEAVTACEHELGPDRVSVAIDVAKVEDQPLALKAFPSLLSQVFVNLLTNSAHAIEGTGKVKITARLVPGERVRVDFEDTGSGILKEHLHKVFEPFFTTKEQGRGTGLGLSICLGFVEKHGGTIEAKKSRKGAHFVIELPLEPIVEASDPWSSGPLLSPSATASFNTGVG